MTPLTITADPGELRTVCLSVLTDDDRPDPDGLLDGSSGHGRMDWEHVESLVTICSAVLDCCDGVFRVKGCPDFVSDSLRVGITVGVAYDGEGIGDGIEQTASLSWVGPTIAGTTYANYYSVAASAYDSKPWYGDLVPQDGCVPDDPNRAAAERLAYYIETMVATLNADLARTQQSWAMLAV